MARRPRSSQLETRTARLKLPARRKPHYTTIGPGIAVGYRRNKGAGSWSAKVADGHGGHWIKAFAIADDFEDNDGAHVLTYWQAQDKARAIARGGNVSGDRPITVSEALDNYAAELKSRNGHDGNIDRVRRDLTPALAAKTVALLTARDLRHWRDAMLKRGLAPATADRTARALKAALALAAREDHRIANTPAWRDGLSRLPDTEVARNEILPDGDVRKLVAAAYGVSPAFGLWIELHAVTGARRSQLIRLLVRDLQDDSTAPRLMMPSSRKGRRKRIDRKPVPITPALAKALRRAAAGRALDDVLLPQPAGFTALRNWFNRAVAAAGLDPKVTPYALRHSSIVRMLLAGTPTRVVAAHHDTSVPMIEKNYSAHISEHADALTRRTLLDLGTTADSTAVVPLRGGR
jgi:integrase